MKSIDITPSVSYKFCSFQATKVSQIVSRYFKKIHPFSDIYMYSTSKIVTELLRILAEYV